MQTLYYCVQGATSIYRTFLEYRKIQELSNLNNELERQKHVTEALTSYSTLIRNDINQLMHMFFKSACENLNYALNSDGESRNNYILVAKTRFIDATTVEKNENLILSYIGLAICQIAHNEIDNSIMTLEKIKSVNCVLPDDYEELSSMMQYHRDWWPLVFKLFANSIFQRSSNLKEKFDGLYKAVPFDTILESKEYMWRRLNAFKSCGGFTAFPYDEKQLFESDKKAMRQILQEDFDAFKTKVIQNIVVKQN